VKKATEEEPSSDTETEAAPAANDETPPVVETTAAVENKNETAEAQDVADKSEAEETNPAAEETSETAEEEDAEEKPEIKVGVVKNCRGILIHNFIF
jgi:cytochrome c oxidase subunit 6b